MSLVKRCVKFQEQILTESNWPDELKQHVEDCESCKSFAETIMQAESLKNLNVVTPTALRENTKADAFSHLSEKQIQKTNFVQNLWNSPKLVIGLAIAFLLIFIIAFNTNLYWENDILKNFNWTILITIIIQNMIMAIFVPLFFSTKSNFFNISKRS
jgi:hypothetical protein